MDPPLIFVCLVVITGDPEFKLFTCFDGKKNPLPIH